MLGNGIFRVPLKYKLQYCDEDAGTHNVENELQNDVFDFESGTEAAADERADYAYDNTDDKTDERASAKTYLHKVTARQTDNKTH